MATGMQNGDEALPKNLTDLLLFFYVCLFLVNGKIVVPVFR